MGEPQGERREMTSTSTDILNLIDGFIDQISKIRTILKGVSVSALILTPLAIVLSIFLLTHSSREFADITYCFAAFITDFACL
jgi:hypothetical protein